MAFPSPTKTYHTDTYPAINPGLPSLSTKGKNIVITGGGSGIGPVIAASYAKSGAAHINLLGRTEKTLLSTKDSISARYPNTKVSTYVADITDVEALQKAFSSISENAGPVNVLVANAGYLPDLTSIADAKVDEWFNGFEVNVKGNFNLIRAFIPYATSDAAVLNISTGATHLPYMRLYGGYHASKLAAVKFFDYVHHEYPELFVLSIHPGVIMTAMNDKTAGIGDPLPYDDVQLPADFTVWAASPEAKFLNGKFVWAHWDVDELKAMKGEIESTNKFTLGLLGWP